MATDTRRSRPVRTIVLLTILTILLPFGALLAGWQLDEKSSDNPNGASLAPGLALDLQGGTQVILKAVTSDGSEVTPEAMEEAIGVIRQRVDANGVTEAEIAAQGSNQIVVEIPGEVDDETIALISKAAQMKFRPVLTYGAPQPTPTAEPSASPSASGDDAAADDGAGATVKEIAALEKKITAEAKDVDPTDPSDLAQITPSVQKLYDELDCTDPKNLEGGGGDHPDQVLVTCDQTGAAKYILGPVEVDGTNLSGAASGLMPGANGTVTNTWGVTLDFNSEGATQFRETTERLVALESPRNQFAIVLDGLIVSAPSINEPITNGEAQISGSFTQDSAATLANQLSFGSLPLTFEVEGENQISATLGSEQLQRGLFAGLIGLALVVVYSMFQYRTLGLLTVMSLVVAGAMTYVVIALLSWGMGYRLSLPGIAGLIVAIGFTADSFIVYFERIRDELRDGRSLRLAVQRGWVRARRTVLAAKSVNLLSAVILYFMTVGGVRGFAFTLGLTTIIDIMVVFWFTHPVMELIAKIPFFRDGHKWSGLSADRLDLNSGPRYRGAGQFSGPKQPAADAPDLGAPSEERELVTAQSVTPVPRTAEDGRRMTIAERRAAERKAAAEAAQNEEKH
ncbi:preprotein translocase subunit SecD [Promicromonospora sp. AC04]|uniref:protein translocase subunit SecD n=1 Tax=Promicromonospora sp. AC04 TaxID=2135723 RepID=UPI000D423D9E|nr:protein translocase subunit SecD [Promicromonospora sp. AC04]PUB25434.1 preprotein translocase subunit SecD [Promicromonospora sp. AC04]